MESMTLKFMFVLLLHLLLLFHEVFCKWFFPPDLPSSTDVAVEVGRALVEATALHSQFQSHVPKQPISSYVSYHGSEQNEDNNFSNLNNDDKKFHQIDGGNKFPQLLNTKLENHWPSHINFQPLVNNHKFTSAVNVPNNFGNNVNHNTNLQLASTPHIHQSFEIINNKKHEQSHQLNNNFQHNYQQNVPSLNNNKFDSIQSIIASLEETHDHNKNGDIHKNRTPNKDFHINQNNLRYDNAEFFDFDDPLAEMYEKQILAEKKKLLKEKKQIEENRNKGDVLRGKGIKVLWQNNCNFYHNDNKCMSKIFTNTAGAAANVFSLTDPNRGQGSSSQRKTLKEFTNANINKHLNDKMATFHSNLPTFSKITANLPSFGATTEAGPQNKKRFHNGVSQNYKLQSRPSFHSLPELSEINPSQNTRVYHNKSFERKPSNSPQRNLRNYQKPRNRNTNNSKSKSYPTSFHSQTYDSNPPSFDNYNNNNDNNNKFNVNNENIQNYSPPKRISKNQYVLGDVQTSQDIYSIKETSGNRPANTYSNGKSYNSQQTFYNIQNKNNKQKLTNNYDKDEEKTRAPYHFQYDVDSQQHDTRFQHREVSDGKKVSGMYRVRLPDGRVQTVTYVADHNGFRPVITYEGDQKNTAIIQPPTKH